jgi:glycosyltransferase involved in cell wall biosynthesis
VKSFPKISVIIPSYNKAEFIGETLESIVRQDYSNLEVILMDGGSNDGTIEIIKSFAKEYPKIIKWESKKDNGQVDAINKGMRKAEGDILTYINADDTYYGQAFKKVGEYFFKNPETLWLAGRGRVIDSDGQEIEKNAMSYKNFLLKLNWRSLLLMVNYLMQPSVFFARRAYEDYGPFVGTNAYVLEYDYWLKLSKLKMPKVISKTLSSFRITGTNISSISYSKLLADDYRLVKKYTKNPFVLFLHKLNNWGRVITINLLK